MQMSTHGRDKTVGFIGLGMMGQPMAANILKAGHALAAFDVLKAKVDHIVGLGGQAASSPADVARRASIVISMVDTTAQAEEVIVGPGGLIDAVQSGDVIISMSTIDPNALRAMHATLAKKGVGLIDAPVSGMEKGAKAGTLKAYVGGDAVVLEKATPVLKAMTAEIVHFGPIGQGTTMKLINNLLCQVQWVVTAEALVLGTKAGLDPTQMVQTILKATGNSVAFEYSAPRILERNFDGIRLDVSFKDLELQTQLAKSLQVPMFMTNVAQQVYQVARAMGLGSEDGGATLVKVYEQMTGVTVRGQ
jgi:3-hydroxyisobutyrate dehydrogenase-like beta-hydroxyacid dehydrogenase